MDLTKKSEPEYPTIDNFEKLKAGDYNKLYQHIKLGYSYGRGVFANRDFNTGEILEIAPFILGKEHGFPDYVFTSHLEDYKTLLVLGYGSIYNHDDKPNVKYILKHATSDKVEDSYFVYYALEPIKKGQECKISYGKNWWKSRDLTPQLGGNKKKSKKTDKFYLKK